MFIASLFIRVIGVDFGNLVIKVVDLGFVLLEYLVQARIRWRSHFMIEYDCIFDSL